MTISQSEIILCFGNDSHEISAIAEALESSYVVRQAVGSQNVLKIFLAEEINLVIAGCHGEGDIDKGLFLAMQSARPFCKKIFVGKKASSADEGERSVVVHKYLEDTWNRQVLLDAVSFLLHDRATDIFIAKVSDLSVKFRPHSAGDDDDEDSGEQYGQFLETFRTGVCLINDEGKISYVNSKGLKLLQCKNTVEIKGKPLEKVFNIDPANHELFFEKYTIRDWSPLPVEVTLCNGEQLTMMVNVSFAETNKNKIVSILFDSEQT